MVEEVTEECIFDPSEAPVCEMVVMKFIHGTEAENQIDGSDEEGNLPFLPSGQIINPMEEDIVILRFIGITIYDDNDP